jgi:hypothetical protein
MTVKKFTHEEFMETLKNKECLKYLKILGIYKGSEEPILVRCNRCGKEYNLLPRSISKNKYGCINCCNIKYSNEEYIVKKIINNIPQYIIYAIESRCYIQKCR